MEPSGTVATTGSVSETVTLELTRGRTHRTGGAAVQDGWFSESPPKSRSCEEPKLCFLSSSGEERCKCWSVFMPTPKLDSADKRGGLTWLSCPPSLCSPGPSPPPSSAGETTIGRQRVHGGSRGALAAPPPNQLIFCRNRLRIFVGSVCWGALMSTGADAVPGKDGSHRCFSVESTQKEPGLRWNTQIIAPL